MAGMDRRPQDDPVVRGLLTESFCFRPFHHITSDWVEEIPPLFLGKLFPLLEEMPPNSSIPEHFGTPAAPNIQPFPPLLASVLALHTKLKEATAAASRDWHDLLNVSVDATSAHCDLNRHIAGNSSPDNIVRTCLLLCEQHTALGTAFQTATTSAICCFELLDSFTSLLHGDALGERDWILVCWKEDLAHLYYGAFVIDKYDSLYD